MTQDRARRLALAFEGAFAEFGVVGLDCCGRDGSERGEGGALELCRDELAAGCEELVEAGEKIGVFGRPSGEGREGHVHASGDVRKRALLEECGEDVIVMGGVCVFHR